MTPICSPTQKCSDHTPDFWPDVLQALKGQTTAGIFDQLIKPLTITHIAGGVLYLTTPNAGTRALETQWKPRILAAIPQTYGIHDLVFSAQRTAFIAADDPLPDDDDQPDLSVTGAYHAAHNAIIQPDHKEYNQATQYYRTKWRPLLGPLLSELVRELRQRCNYHDGRNTFGVTYKALAQTLGVSERTIYRSLERDQNGDFKNAYLKYFIAETQTVKTRSANGHYRNLKTAFVVYLDDALTPEDQAKSGQQPPY